MGGDAGPTTTPTAGCEGQNSSSDGLLPRDPAPPARMFCSSSASGLYGAPRIMDVITVWLVLALLTVPLPLAVVVLA